MFYRVRFEIPEMVRRNYRVGCDRNIWIYQQLGQRAASIFRVATC